jgi:hypothetical protein
MKVQCPHCGQTVTVGNFGRRPLTLSVTKVCDTLRLHRSVPSAARELQCSRAYIYKVLKADGLKPADVIKGLATKSITLLHFGG